MKLLGLEFRKSGSAIMVRRSARRQKAARSNGFAAAAPLDMLSSWTRTPVPINARMAKDLRSLRARSREEGVDNPYAHRFLNLARGNIVGPDGFILRSRVKNTDGTADRVASKGVEEAWKAYGEAQHCSMNKVLDLVAIQNAYATSVAEDGESLWMAVYGSVAGEWGVAFHQIDAELLDINLNVDMPGRPRICMGIEVNSWGQPIAYYFHKSNLTSYIQTSQFNETHQRIPADRIFHGFLRERAGQLRGVPWMAPSLIRMRELHMYTEAAVTNARNGANKLGFIENATEEEFGTKIDPVTGDQIMESDPGSWFVLGQGQKVGGWNPDYPHNQFGEFVKATLREISSGLLVDYAGLSGDGSDVNYGSLRGLTIETRESWRALQGNMSRGFMSWMFQQWLPWALAKEKIMVKGGVLDIRYLDKYRRVSWQGRTWPWIDPLKDSQANGSDVDQKFKSRSQVIRESGNDPDEVWDEIEAENEKLATRKILVPEFKPIPMTEAVPSG